MSTYNIITATDESAVVADFPPKSRRGRSNTEYYRDKLLIFKEIA